MAYIPRQLVSDTSSVLNDQSSSSSSSFSMSFTCSDDFVEDIPSTSGCSSDMAHSEKLGHKEKMKRYLRELRTIIKPYHHKGGKIGTLSALEHVLSSLREQNEKKTKNPGEPVEGCEEGGNITSFPKCVSLDTEQLVLKNELRIILNVKGLTVSCVSQNIKETLGHSKDSWLGRLLTDFVHKSDLFTFQSCIHIEALDSFLKDSDSDSKTPSEIPERTVFFRLKCFKSLVAGFSLKKEDVYKPFKVLVRYKNLYPSTIENYMAKNYVSSPLGTSGEKTELSPPSFTDFDSSSGTYEVKKKYIVLDCMTLTSSYKELGQLPVERTFNTRHTSFCCYSYILPSVTELMGYLPQEMIGSSVFDFYHPDDLNELYKTYKTIIQLKGTPFRSKPVRFRTKNGDWIVTETEWSSFINPWSKKLEFIIGQHTVIKGPENLNVFQEAPHPREPPSEQTLRLHQMIKDLLQQPLDTFDLTRCKKTEKMSSLRNEKHDAILDEPMETTEDDSSFTKDGRGNNYETTKFMTTHQVWRSRPNQIRKEHLRNTNDADHCHLPEHVSPKVFDDTSKSMAYDQLNYTSNIKRFLLSQPRSFSPKSDLNNGSSEGYDEEEYEDADPEFEVDISVPKPPSFGSSTKRKPRFSNMVRDKYAGKLFNFTGYKQLYHNQVLVSEQGHHEDPSASPRHIDENTLEDCLPKDLRQPPTSASNVPMEDYPRKVTLTQEILWKHTKLQEELYVAEAKQDRSLFGLSTDRSDIFSNRVQRKKRTRSPDNSSFIHNQIVEKIPRLCKEKTFGNVLHPPFPLDSNPSVDSTNGNIIPTHPSVTGMTGPVYPFIKVTHLIQPNINVLAPISPSSTSPSASNNNGSGSVEWPYYPVSGGSLNPQVMVGFYQQRFGFVPAYPNISSKPQDLLTQGKFQNREGRSQNMTVITPVPTPNAYSPELAEMQKLSGQFPPVISSSEFSSLEDTGSSFMYLLETDSAHLSEISTQALDKLQMERQYEEPFWLEGIHYTKDIELHYQLPLRKRSQVLKENCEAVGRHMQPDLVEQQLKILLEDLEQEKPNQSVIDEEADYVIFLDDGEEFAVEDGIESDYLHSDSSSGNRWSEFWNSGFCGTMQSANPQSLSQTDTPPPLHLEEHKYEENKDHGYQSSEPYKINDQEKGVKYEGRCMDGTTSQQMLNKQEENMESIELNLLPADENIIPSQAKSLLDVNNDTIQEYFVSDEGNLKCVTNMETSEGHNISPSDGQMKSSERDIDYAEKHMKSMEQNIDPSLGKSKSTQLNIDPSERHMESLEANVDSSEDMESNYSKQSSDLTLSDQRSSEEAASSLKESDSSYKKQTYKSKKHVRFERNMKEVDSLFDKLFVSLPVSFPHLKKRLAPWQTDVNKTQLIQMEFTLRKRDLKDILARDKVMLDEVVQPALVSEQFQVLMHELDGQVKSVEDLLENSKPTTDLYWEDTADMTKE